MNSQTFFFCWKKYKKIKTSFSQKKNNNKKTRYVYTKILYASVVISTLRLRFKIVQNVYAFVAV